MSYGPFSQLHQSIHLLSEYVEILEDPSRCGCASLERYIKVLLGKDGTFENIRMKS